MQTSICSKLTLYIFCFSFIATSLSSMYYGNDSLIMATRHFNLENDSLIMATRSFDLNLVEQLLQEGADPNLADREIGATALHFACFNFVSQAKLVKLLLKAGANWEATTIDNETPLEWISDNQNNEERAEICKLFEKIDFFQSYEHCKNLRTTEQGKKVWKAFWIYIEGNPHPLNSILQDAKRTNNHEILSAFRKPIIDIIYNFAKEQNNQRRNR